MNKIVFFYQIVITSNQIKLLKIKEEISFDSYK